MHTRSHVAALVRSDGRSVKQIERDADLREGTIAYYFKPSSPQSARLPRLDVMQRFAGALRVDFEVVTNAFLRDAGIPCGEEFGPEEVQMIYRVRALPAPDQARLLGIITVFEND